MEKWRRIRGESGDESEEGAAAEERRDGEVRDGWADPVD